MLVVIPFWKGDEDICLSNLRLAKALSGRTGHKALIVCENDTSPSNVQLAADQVFSQTATYRYDPFRMERKWPQPQNYAWQNTARYIEQKIRSPWFWWETDAVPLKPDWLDKLQAEYESAKKLFLGHFVEGMGHMNGVAIYPPSISHLCPEAMICRGSPWDVMLKDASRKYGHRANHLIQHVWNLDEDLKPSKLPQHAAPSFPYQETVDAVVQSDAVLFHRCKDGSLGERIMERLNGVKSPTAPQDSTPKRHVYSHSGDLGDIIYSLAATKATGGGTFCLTENNRTRIKMTPQRAEVIQSLLEVQPYISKVQFGTQGARVTKNFDAFVDRLLAEDYHYGTPSAKLMAEVVGANPECINSPWLEVDHPTVIPGKTVIINRSIRYQNYQFPWNKVRDEFGSSAIFLGLKEEYELFKQQCDWPDIAYARTGTLLEAARLISGCRLFLGNQSALYAIAEGLKKARVLEVFHGRPDCLFYHHNVIHGWDDFLTLNMEAA